MRDLDLGLIGNGTISALVDATGTVVWACFPRFDGDPTFCALLQHPPVPDEAGLYAIDLLDMERTEQEYLPNTAVLVTEQGTKSVHQAIRAANESGETISSLVETMDAAGTCGHLVNGAGWVTRCRVSNSSTVLSAQGSVSPSQS